MPAVPKITSSLFTFLPYRRNNQDSQVDDSTGKEASTAFTSAALRYRPRPSQMESAFSMHPLAGEWPLVPKPKDIEALVIAPPVSDVARVQSQSQDMQPIHIPPPNQISPSSLVHIPSPILMPPSSLVIAPPVSNEARAQTPAQGLQPIHFPPPTQTSPSSLVIAPPGSDEARAQTQAQDMQPKHIPSPILMPPSSLVIAPPDEARAQTPAQGLQPIHFPPPIQMSPSSLVIAPFGSDEARAQTQAQDMQPIHISSPILMPPSSLVIAPPDEARVQTPAQGLQPINFPPPIQMSPALFPAIAQPHGHRPMVKYTPKRRNDRSRFMFTTDALGPIIEKTRLVEQSDLTTRKIIEDKDQKISELEAQV